MKSKEKTTHFWSKKSKSVKDETNPDSCHKDDVSETPRGLYIPPSDTDGSFAPSSPVESSLKHTQSDVEYPVCINPFQFHK